MAIVFYEVSKPRASTSEEDSTLIASTAEAKQARENEQQQIHREQQTRRELEARID